MKNMSSKLDIKSIFQEYKDKIYHLAVSIARNEKDAEDILQDTFIKIIKNAKRFKNQSKISTWIYRIAYNEALSVLRKKKQTFKIYDSVKEYPDITKAGGLFLNHDKPFDKILIDKELRLVLNKAIDKIPLKYRLVFLFSCVEKLNGNESASALGLNLNSFKTRLRRANKMLGAEMLCYLKDKQSGVCGKIYKKDGRCDLWTGFAYDFARGEANSKKQDIFKKHILVCPSCRSFIDIYIRSIIILKALNRKKLPSGLKKKIQALLTE